MRPGNGYHAPTLLKTLNDIASLALLNRVETQRQLLLPQPMTYARLKSIYVCVHVNA